MGHMSKRKRKRKTKIPSGSQSGGVNITADKVDIGRDLIGRDKIEAGGHVFQMAPGSTLVLAMGAPDIGDAISQTAFSIQQPSLQQTELEELLESISNKLGKAPSRLVEITSLEDEPPLPPKVLAPRTSLVQSIASRISLITWVSLAAATGLGKTQLARMVQGNYLGDNKIWITIQEQESHLAIAHIRYQLIRVVKAKLWSGEYLKRYTLHTISDKDLHELAAQALGRNSIVIIDNLPMLDAKSPLLSYLLNIVSSLAEYNSTLITTSQTDLPISVSERLGDKFVEVQIPPFDQADIVSLLGIIKAPEQINDEKIITLILVSTGGHPVLVAATLNWLQSIQWKLDNAEALGKLLTGDPAKSVREETVRLLPRLIANEKTRQFLYRLSLLSHAFDDRLAQAVAEVEPSITLPGEKLVELHGPWLSRTPRNTYEVSPLLRGSGQSNLPEQLIRNVHTAIADELLSRSPIPINEVHNIVIHLFASNQGNRLAIFIIQALHKVETKSQAEYFDLIAALFPDDVSERIGISSELMVMVRAVQARLRILNGGASATLLADLDARIAKLDLENEDAAFAALSAYLNTGPFLDGAPAIIGFEQAVKLSRLIHGYPKLATIISFPLPPEEVMWFPLLRIGKLEDYSLILNLIGDLLPEELQGLLSSALGEETIYVWVDRIWHVIVNQSASKADWNSVLDIYARIERIGLEVGSLPLIIAALRAQAIVHADYLKQPNEALRIMENAPQSLTPSQVFILSYTAASILLDASRLDEASNAYRQALAANPQAFAYYHFDALRRMAEISGRNLDWETSATWCVKAIRFAGEHQFVPVEDQIELVAELAWIRWSQGKLKQAAGAMYSVAMKLLRIYKASDLRHKELLLKVGHVLGWIAQSASGADFPKLTVEGEPYVPPFPGMVSRRRERIAQLERPGIESLFMQLGLLAASVGATKTALHAYAFAHDQALTQGLQLLSAIVDSLRAKLASMYLPAEEALEIAASGAMSLGLGPSLGLSVYEFSTSRIDVRQAWLSLPEEKRRSAESFMYWTSFCSAVCYLLERDVQEKVALANLRGWRAGFNRLAAHDKDHWIRLVDAAEYIFRPVIGSAGVKTKLTEITSEDSDLRFVLYLALSVQLDTPLNEIANAQAVVYQFTLNPQTDADGLRSGVAALIARTWRYILEKRGFYLSNPMRLRKLLSETHGQPTEMEVARVLLAAADSVGIQYDEAVYQALSKLVSDQRK